MSGDSVVFSARTLRPEERAKVHILARRILTVLVGLPLLIGAIWLGSPWLTLVVSAAAFVALIEYYRMAPALGSRLILPLAVLWTALLIVAGRLTDRWPDYSPHVVLGAGVLIALPMLILFLRKEGSLTRWTYAVAGPVYVGFLLAHAPMLRELDGIQDSGRDWLLFTLLTIFATDTGAFFTGRAIGKHPMAPAISPKKTWEGAAGGFVWAVGISLACGALLRLSTPFWQLALIGGAIGVLAQVGDLVESAIKRSAGAKDAGGLLPGHGGVLDRIDSIVFTIPVVYYLVALVL